MRGGKGFAIGMTVLLLLLFGLQMNMPKAFDWKPTFGHKDKNPFGCYVFDSIMVQSMPEGYSVTKKTLPQIAGERKRQNVLILTDAFCPNATDMKAVRAIAARGSKVMIAGGYGNSTVDSLMADSIGARLIGMTYLNINALRKKIRDDMENARDTICWQDTAGIYGKAEYTTYSMITYCHVWAANDTSPIVVCRSGNSPVAMRCHIGKGEVTVVSTPLLFTNYGILDSHTTGYVFRMMSRIADAPVTRTTAYMKTADEETAEQSPLRVFLSRPPLRAAIYMALAVVVLLMISAARRRQRIIPVAEPPQNRALEFVQLIGTLYYHKKDHSGIVRKKFGFFADEMRRQLLTDVTDKSADSHNFDIIAQRTGMDRHEVESIVKDIRRVADGETETTEYGVKLYIDQMNMITSRIT